MACDCCPAEFGLSPDDLNAVADAFYPDGDPRRDAVGVDHQTIVRAGMIRSHLRGLADALEHHQDHEEEE